MTSSVRQYAVALGMIAAAATACQSVSGVMDYRSVGMFFLFIIALLSPYVGPGPLFSAATLSAILWDFIFIPPRYTFAISRSADILLVTLYFIIALVTTVLTLRIRRQRDTAASASGRRSRCTSWFVIFRQPNLPTTSQKSPFRTSAAIRRHGFPLPCRAGIRSRPLHRPGAPPGELL